MDVAKAKLNMQVATPVGNGLVGGRAHLNGKDYIIVTIMRLVPADKKNKTPGKMWDYYYLPPEKVTPR